MPFPMRRRTKEICKTVVLSVLALLGLGSSAAASAECAPPPFRVVNESDEVSKGVVLISLRRSDFIIDRLVCLTRSLRASHPRWTDVTVLFFSSRRAAEHFEVIPRDQAARDSYLRLHATYILDVSNREESLQIRPLGYETPETLATMIPKDATSPVACRIQLKDRCALAVRPPTYPVAALENGFSGRVTLSARVDRSGNVKDVRVIASTVPAAANELVRESIESLSGWWLEPRSTETQLQLAYEFTVDARANAAELPGWAPREGLPYRVQFDTSDTITVRGVRIP